MNVFLISPEFLQGSDQTMLNKLHQKHGSNRNYLKPKSDINTSFGLNHFAGVVFYDTRNFLEKNRDTFSADLLQLIHVHRPFASARLERGGAAAGCTLERLLVDVLLSEELGCSLTPPLLLG